MTTTTQQITLISAFDTRGKAEGALHELWHEGFRHDQVGIVTPEGDVRKATSTGDHIEEKAASGAARGAIAGGALGALAGAIAVGVIPGVGPVIAGGLLAGLFGGAAAGAAAGSYLGAFVGLGLSEQEAARYERELKQGRTLVTVQPEDRWEQAAAILREHGGTVAMTHASPPPPEDDSAVPLP